MLTAFTGWAWYWYVFLDPFAFSMVEIPVTRLIAFQNLFLKRHKDNSLEVHEKLLIFEGTLLLGVGNCRCIQQVFGRLSFFTNSKIPLAISYCPNLSCNKRQSSVKISASKMIHLSGIFVLRKGQYSPINALGSFFLQMAKLPTKLL